LDQGAGDDQRIENILGAAEEKGVQVKRVHRKILDEMSQGRVHNGVIAQVDPLPHWTTKQVIDDLFERGEVPFLILMTDCSYEHNLGAVLRSALGFGAHALILPTRKGAAVSPVVQRVAMGAAEEIPVVREGLNSALKHIRKAGIPVVGAAMDGKPMGTIRLGGAVALMMGGEGAGISSQLLGKCTHKVSIPLSGGLESLNVSVAAAVLMYEKRRQDGWYDV
jgi:23S rRNA (guanosine2251-2'-O)-methyltransferase